MERVKFVENDGKNLAKDWTARLQEGWNVQKEREERGETKRSGEEEERERERKKRRREGNEKEKRRREQGEEKKGEEEKGRRTEGRRRGDREETVNIILVFCHTQRIVALTFSSAITQPRSHTPPAFKKTSLCPLVT